MLNDEIIDRLESQAKHLGYVKIMCSAANYERALPAKWFHSLAAAGVLVQLSENYPDCHGIGLIDIKTAEVWWLDLWGDA